MLGYRRPKLILALDEEYAKKGLDVFRLAALLLSHWFGLVWFVLSCLAEILRSFLYSCLSCRMLCAGPLLRSCHADLSEWTVNGRSIYLLSLPLSLSLVFVCLASCFIPSICLFVCLLVLFIHICFPFLITQVNVDRFLLHCEVLYYCSYHRIFGYILECRTLPKKINRSQSGQSQSQESEP